VAVGNKAFVDEVHALLGYRAGKRKKTAIDEKHVLQAKASDQEIMNYPCPKCHKGILIFKHPIAPVSNWDQPLPS
jgi:predicted secreted protein